MVAAAPVRIALDAHVVGRHQTGNETYVIELAGALAARSDVDLVAFLDASAEWPGSPVAIDRLRIGTPFLRLPLELPYRAARSGAQLLHVQYVVPPVTMVPLVTTIHDISFEDLRDAFPRRTELRLKATVRFAARRSRAVIASSSYTRDRILDRYGLDPANVHVAPLGVGAGWHPVPPAEREALLAPLGLPPRFAMAVGN
ncbi:MAG TPA: glycosyltransferase, partial [Candidatus Limnocylindrales bacterium]|nr:glycosyltransferase [Candidatus Limnocylindrales bacterium]